MSDPTVGIYVHVPFCERVCPYCDFAVVATRSLSPETEARYVAALEAELELRREAFAGARLETLYFGGGTPALLSPASIERLIHLAGRHFPGSPREVTLEANPSTLERGRLGAFRQAGVDRLSLGVQSFDDTVLRRLGRAHKAGESSASLAAARAAGFENLSVDLIFGAPDQSLASVVADWAALLDFAPEHVSSYELTIEPGTPFALADARGQLARPDEAEALALYDVVDAGADALGLERYEISSFARPNRESQHNQRYWRRAPVLGLGMGAWSTDPARPDAPHGVRRANPRELPAYLAAVAAGRPASAECEPLLPPVARGEAAFLALRRRQGLDARSFAAEFGGPPRAFFEDWIDSLVGAGLLSENETGDLSLTERGRLLSDTVFEGFVGGGAPPNPEVARELRGDPPTLWPGVGEKG
ncbi:MAG: radical SAM family heme chaperone HemW [Proteobacteria bacterium]|nr:radical SAM family heme chaperone HemW [Pseudomonadota bacterium]